MAWNRNRRVPWKRLFTFELIYAGLFAAFVVLFERDQVTSALSALLVAVVATTVLIAVLWKFGWNPAFLRSRSELAQIRAQRLADRQAARARKTGKTAAPTTAPERNRPAPTRRTSTGATNRPRRTRDNRKR